ncbi:ATP-binding cassette domain-containing protein [Endozoicomonas sp. Mp262]|uniref:ATP-binding cassette domain-containing protein n=1 Tax=Endozoicomonas sp. Mp262 TaxID=2919499 RepID=UPI0021D9589A
MLVLKQFSVFFPKTGHYVLNSLDLQIQPGEIHALIGESGGGKSLIALGLMGILPADARASGQIALNGQVLEGKAFTRVAGRCLSLIPQSVEWLDPLKTIINQVQRSAKRTGMTGHKVKETAASALKRFQLPESAWKKYPHQLSGGMIRRVLLAAATVASPRFLIADEPTNGLDPDSVNLSLAMMRQLADEGCGVLLISHDLPATLKVADRVSVLYQGRCVDQFSVGGCDPIDSKRNPYTRALWQALPENGLNLG